jgi:hypothetical protein
MPGLVPGIQGGNRMSLPPWIAGTSPAMTGNCLPVNKSRQNGKAAWAPAFAHWCPRTILNFVMPAKAGIQV